MPSRIFLRTTRAMAHSCCGVILCAALMILPSAAQAAPLTLMWDPSTASNIAGYRVMYGTTPGSHPTVVDVGNQTSFPLTNLTPAVRYYFVVVAYNASGATSAPSQEVSWQSIGITTLTSNQPS